MKVNNSIDSAQISKADESKKASSASRIRKEKEVATSKAGSSTAGGAASEISSRAKEMATAREVAKNAPDIREDKVAELKKKIANKEYNVSADDIADKLVNEHLQTMGLG